MDLPAGAGPPDGLHLPPGPQEPAAHCLPILYAGESTATDSLSTSVCLVAKLYSIGRKSYSWAHIS